MPANTRVHRCVEKIKRKGGNANPYAVCSASTGQSYATGKNTRESDKKPVGSPKSESFNRKLSGILENLAPDNWLHNARMHSDTLAVGQRLRNRHDGSIGTIVDVYVIPPLNRRANQARSILYTIEYDNGNGGNAGNEEIGEVYELVGP